MEGLKREESNLGKGKTTRVLTAAEKKKAREKRSVRPEGRREEGRTELFQRKSPRHFEKKVYWSGPVNASNSKKGLEKE